MSFVRVGEDRTLGLRGFNHLVHSYVTKDTLLGVRMNALLQLAQDKHALHSLAEYFKQEKPHWGFLNGNDYATCKYVIARLSCSEEEFHREPWGEHYVRVRINIDPDKHAYVKKQRVSRRGSCRIHPEIRDVSHGLCVNCYARYNKLIKRGMISSTTPLMFIDKIMNLPSMRGRGCRFIHAVEDILRRGLN